MMKIKKRNLFTCLVVGIIGLWGILFNSTETLYADSTDSAYSVSANIPEEQTNKDVSYFDLTVAPNDTRDLSIHLSNVGEKDSVFEIEINNAATNTNGVIDYNQSTFKKDASAKYTISDVLITDSKEVTVKAGEAKDVHFHLKMPKETFDGILLGGIHVSKKDNQSEKVSGTAIRNKYAYVVGVELRNNSNPVTPDLKLLSVKAGLQNSYATIFAHLQNPTPTIISQVHTKAVITKNGSSKVLYSAEKDNMSIAPNTNFNFPISLDKKKMDAGTYTLTMDATEGKTQKKWHLTKTFTIKSDKAKKINKEAVIEEKESISYLSIIIGVGIFLLGIIAFLSYKLFKQKGR
ncbi:DUF916 and DUF3324 domain-containing protein [Enterococcus villorum]|uniref:DUF916 and DUF3324 domain-containing protein n=1 Tax=Enterococcus villorum TaxID=112904 RepID=UPI003F8AE386